MNRAEAINALEQGKSITHRLFGEDEFIKKSSDFTYVDEMGIEVDIDEFWAYRTSVIFNEGWDIYDDEAL